MKPQYAKNPETNLSLFGCCFFVVLFLVYLVVSKDKMVCFLKTIIRIVLEKEEYIYSKYKRLLGV